MAKNEMEDWTGAVGDRWLAHIDGFEGMLSLLHGRLAELVAPDGSESILDVGCGGGPLSLRLARNAGHVTGLDVAPQLVALAQSRAEEAGLANLTFEAGDASTASPAGAPFDALVSAFGVMFFDDSEEAFRHLHSLVKPGGRMQFFAWAAPDRNPWMGMVMGVMAQHLDLPEPDPTAPGPFRFGDAQATSAMLAAAGFSNVVAEPIEQLQPLGGPGASVDQAVAFVLAALDVGTLIDEQGADRAAITSDLKAALTPHATDEGVMLPGCALYYSGTA